MTRKSVLALIMAVVLLASAPACAARKPSSVSNFNKSGMAANTASDKDSSLNLPKEQSEEMSQVLDTGAPLSSSFEGGPANDPLANFGPSSGTVVGNRALELRDEVLRLRSSVNMNANEFSILRANGAAGAVQYHSTVAAITARLQNGTTRGNPILLRQWDEAESSLNEVTHSLDRLNSLQTGVSADASLASYLLESVQAGFQLSGAVDEDHDQLKLLRDEVSRQIVQLDYLSNQVTGDIQRQTAYLTTERSNLQALAFAITRGELLGNSLANRPVIVNSPTMLSLPPAPAPMYAPAPTAAPQMPVTQGKGPSPMSPREYMQETDQPSPQQSSSTGAPSAGRLLVLIRFNQPTVEYAQQLSRAVSTALEREPNAEFSVIAVSPSSGTPGELATQQEAATRNAEEVKRSLIQLGLTPSRITLANSQMQSATTPEVHIYVR
ncbi:MAG: hypothetical protein PHY92_05675 [Alphaproteobacteria bacterium]|nr:hypothetical protein [Alphaproteobacteria bacterium]